MFRSINWRELAGAGARVSSSLGGPAWTGTPGDDTHAGGGGDDILRGGKGDDDLSGAGGADSLVGGKGLDRLNGGEGADTLLGGKGKDLLVVGAGGGVIDGGAGIDTLDASGLGFGLFANASGGSVSYPAFPANALKLDNGDTQSLFSVEVFEGSRFDDTFYAGAAASTMRGNGGADHLEGSSLNDRFYGGGGDDYLDGEGGNDMVQGGDGADTLRSGYGKDTLVGGVGDDKLTLTDNGDAYGGAGADTIEIWSARIVEDRLIYGDSGADTFWFGSYGRGVIQDFTPGEDKVDLSTMLSREQNLTWEEIQAQMSERDGATVITIDFDTVGGGEIVLLQVTPGELSESDFVF